MNKEKKHIGLQAFALFWCVVTLFPLYFTFLSSMKNTTQIYKSPFSLPTKFSLANYLVAIQKGGVLRAIFNSFILAVATVLLVLLVSSTASYIISRRRGKLYQILYVYFMAGILIPIHCTFIPLVRMVSKIKGNNSYIVLITIFVALNLPLSFLLLTGYMKGISKELEEAAIIDGCNSFKIYAVIIMPLSKPILATSGILTFLAVYNDLMFSLLFITKKQLYPISLALNMFKGQHAIEYGPIFASIALSIMPMLIAYTFLQDKIIAGICAGAVKG